MAKFNQRTWIKPQEADPLLSEPRDKHKRARDLRIGDILHWEGEFLTVTRWTKSVTHDHSVYLELDGPRGHMGLQMYQDAKVRVLGKDERRDVVKACDLEVGDRIGLSQGSYWQVTKIKEFTRVIHLSLERVLKEPERSLLKETTKNISVKPSHEFWRVQGIRTVQAGDLKAMKAITEGFTQKDEVFKPKTREDLSYIIEIKKKISEVPDTLFQAVIHDMKVSEIRSFASWIHKNKIQDIKLPTLSDYLIEINQESRIWAGRKEEFVIWAKAFNKDDLDPNVLREYLEDFGPLGDLTPYRRNESVLNLTLARWKADESLIDLEEPRLVRAHYKDQQDIKDGYRMREEIAPIVEEDASWFQKIDIRWPIAFSLNSTVVFAIAHYLL